MSETDDTLTVEYNPFGGEFSSCQWEFMRDQHKRVILLAGRGSGKDHTCVRKAIYETLKLYIERIKSGFVRDDARVMVAFVSPVVQNFLPSWVKIKRMVPKVPGVARDGKPNYRVFEESKEIHLFGRDELVYKCYSAYDTDNLRGDGWDYAIVTEAAFLNRTQVDALMKFVSRSDYYGKLIMNSTPRPKKGQDDWFDVACDQARAGRGAFGDFVIFEPSDKGWTSFHNPRNTRENEESMWREASANPRKFLIERLAVTNIEETPPDDDIMEHPFYPSIVEPSFVSVKPQLGTEKIVAYDLAWGGVDDLVEVVIDTRSRFVEHIQVAKPKRISDKAYDFKNTESVAEHTIIPMMLEAVRKYGSQTRLAYDAGGLGARMIQYLPQSIRRHATPIKVRFTTKAGLVVDVATMFGYVARKEWNALQLPHPVNYPFDSDEQRNNFKRLYSELYMMIKLTLRKSWGEFISYGKPDGGTDDVADAFIYAASLLDHKPLHKLDKRPPSRLFRAAGKVL